MTREEFEDWFDERRDEALDNVQQSDTTAQKWLARLHAALKAIADEEDAEDSEPEDEDLLGDEEDIDDPEEDAANSSDVDEDS
jgi:hypothetical protein